MGREKNLLGMTKKFVSREVTSDDVKILAMKKISHNGPRNLPVMKNTYRQWGKCFLCSASTLS